jgi:GcrA cell cycle regulator
MAIHAEASDASAIKPFLGFRTSRPEAQKAPKQEKAAATAAEFRRALAALAITPRRVAKLVNVGSRTVRRWQDGSRHIPFGIIVLFRLLAAQVLTIGEIEAVIAAPVWTNGGPVPPTPRRIEPVPEQPEAAILTDSSSTVVEQILALTPETCHWPFNDPGRPDFRFCHDPVTRGRPYCARHCNEAYVALPPQIPGHATLRRMAWRRRLRARSSLRA